MAVPLSINPTARDLTFEFNDSCNCCCFGKPSEPHEDTHVFVNSKGEVAQFDPKKASDERESMKRTISNLQHIIGNMSDGSLEQRVMVLEEVERTIIPLRIDSPNHVSLKMVRQMINVAETFKTAHSSSASPQSVRSVRFSESP